MENSPPIHSPIHSRGPPKAIFQIWIAEIIGSEAQKGRVASAGEIFDIIDIAAARAAILHSKCRVVTLSFDRVELTRPIMHNDLVRLEAAVVHVGNSSLTVLIDGFRQDITCRTFSIAFRSIVTMVAVDSNLRPWKLVPKLIPPTNEHMLRLTQFVKTRRNFQQEIQHKINLIRPGNLLRSEIEDPLNKRKTEYLSIEETLVSVRKQFLPKDHNVYNTIFGGQILVELEKIARTCASRFCRNENVVTIAMDQIRFFSPIFSTDLTELQARVVYVRNFVVQVSVVVFVHRIFSRNSNTKYASKRGSEKTPQRYHSDIPAPSCSELGADQVIYSHKADFTLLSVDKAGFKRPILTGLRLSNQDQIGLTLYHKSKTRFQYWQDYRVKHSSSHDTDITLETTPNNMYVSQRKSNPNPLYSVQSGNVNTAETAETAETADSMKNVNSADSSVANGDNSRINQHSVFKRSPSLKDPKL